MSESLLTDGRILTRIIQAHKDNDEALKQPKSCRKGYMGQLRLISNLIQQKATEEAWMRAHTQAHDWVAFCDTYLAQLNDVNDGRQLGRAHGNGLVPQSDGEEEEEEALDKDEVSAIFVGYKPRGRLPRACIAWCVCARARVRVCVRG